MIEIAQGFVGRNEEFGAAVTSFTQSVQHFLLTQPSDPLVQSGWRTQMGQTDGLAHCHGLTFMPAQHDGLEQSRFVGVHQGAVGQGFNSFGQLQKPEVSFGQR